MSEHELYAWTLSLGWTLIHFLWQGGLIALALAAFLALTRERSSGERYAVRCAALVMMAIAPVVTFIAVRGAAPVAPAAPAAAFPSDSAQGVQEELVGTPWFSWLAAGDLFSWIVVLWCLGAALCSLRLTGGLYQVLRLRRRAAGIDLAPRWQRRFDRLAREFGVRARARVVECASVAVPTVIGWAKPVVLLPARIFTGLSDEQIEALIAHELAHVARHDYLVNFLQSILEALLFYHPAVWWVSRGIRVEREYCCDDRAVAATHDGLSYARALTALESWRGGEPQLGVSTLGGSLMQRIQRLVGGKPVVKPGPVRPFHALAALALVGSMGASAFGLAAFPDPATDGDCPCPCHQKNQHKEKAPPPKVDGTRVWTSKGGGWVAGEAAEGEEAVRRAWARIADEEDVRLDFTRGKADAEHLHQSVAELKDQIAALETQIAELQFRTQRDLTELVKKVKRPPEKEGAVRDFWTQARRRPPVEGAEREWKVERFYQQGKANAEERAHDAWLDAERARQEVCDHRDNWFEYSQQARKQAERAQQEAQKAYQEAKKYLKIRSHYDPETGELSVEPYLKGLEEGDYKKFIEFYRQQQQGAEAPPPPKRIRNRIYYRDAPEGEMHFGEHGEADAPPGWFHVEGVHEGEYILNRPQRVRLEREQLLDPGQLHEFREQIRLNLEQLKHIELEDVDLEDFQFGDVEFEYLDLGDLKGVDLLELGDLEGLEELQELDGVHFLDLAIDLEDVDLRELQDLHLEKLQDLNLDKLQGLRFRLQGLHLDELRDHLDLLEDVEEVDEIELDLEEDVELQESTLKKLLEGVGQREIQVLETKDANRIIEIKPDEKRR